MSKSENRQLWLVFSRTVTYYTSWLKQIESTKYYIEFKQQHEIQVLYHYSLITILMTGQLSIIMDPLMISSAHSTSALTD